MSLTRSTFAAGYGVTAHLYGGGFKHFDVPAFLAVVKTQPWKDRANVQLLLKNDADDRFELYQLHLDHNGETEQELPS